MTSFLLIYLAICAGVAMGVSVLIRRWRPSWPPAALSLLAGAFLPALVWIVCIWLYFSVACTPEDVGDSCGMAMAGSIIMALMGAAGLPVGWLAAYVLQMKMRR